MFFVLRFAYNTKNTSLPARVIVALGKNVKIFLSLLFGIVVGFPLLFLGYFFSMSFSERLEEKKMTKLVSTSGLELADDYFCLEAKCFGTFELNDNRKIEFFIVTNIAEKVVEESLLLSENWSSADSICHKLEVANGVRVCHLGGKIYSSNEYLNENCLEKQNP